MELNNNEAAVCADSGALHAGTSGEIDLYGELVAFAKLSPEEQLRSADRHPGASAETATAPEHETEERPVHEPIRTPETEPAETGAAAAEETETPPADGTQEQDSLQAVQLQTSIEPAEEEMADIEPEASPSDEPKGDDSSPKRLLTRAPIQGVEADDGVTAGPGDEASRVKIEPGEAHPSQVEGRPRPSGPLSGFNLPPDIVYTGALSPGVCVACGAESAADDLFCITCGVFIDEIGTTLPVSPKCAACKQEISSDEIFCPWCGSALPV